MKKYIIIIIALLFSLSVTAQRKTVTDKLQVTGVKNAEILSTDSKGNLVAGNLEEIKSDFFNKLEALKQELNNKIMQKVGIPEFSNFAGQIHIQLKKIDKLATDVSNNFVRINEAFDEFSPFHAMFDEWRSVSFGNSEEIAGVKNILGTEVARLEELVNNTGKVKTVNNIAPDANGNVTIPGGTSSGLEKITQNGKTGWRLAGVNANLYAEIGVNAVDLSHMSWSAEKGASGNYSFASGSNTAASGTSSFASGSNTAASGTSSFASGRNTAASGNYSFATGYGVVASGDYSFASGGNIKANGNYSFASGSNTTASGNHSFVSGYGPKANGTSSFATGYYTKAESTTEFVIGALNTEYTPKNNSTDRAFVIGNGTGGNNRSDALIVYKNGNMDLNGLLKLKPISTPTTPEKGTIYFDQTDNKLKCYDGTVWQNLW